MQEFLFPAVKSKGTDEIGVAQAVSRKLITLGFEPYVAIGEQSLKGIKENIFPNIEQSEYFIFIDFKRDKLKRWRVQRFPFLSPRACSCYISWKGGTCVAGGRRKKR